MLLIPLLLSSILSQPLSLPWCLPGGERDTYGVSDTFYNPPCCSFKSTVRHAPCCSYSCCFLPFCPSPYHSPDVYQEEKEKFFSLSNNILLKLPILKRSNMLLVLVMIYWLKGRYCWFCFKQGCTVCSCDIAPAPYQNYHCPRYTSQDITSRDFYFLYQYLL